MRIYSVLKFVIVYLIWIALGVLLFIGFFQLPIFTSVDILFYRGILISILASFTLAVILRLYGNALTDAIAHATFAFGLNLSILIVFPVTIDRSVTIFLLNEISRTPENRLTKQELEELLIRRYIKEYHAVDRRMEEQIRTGHITKIGESYTLSPLGIRFMDFSRFIGRLFHTDPRFIDNSAPSQLPAQ